LLLIKLLFEQKYRIVKWYVLLYRMIGTN